MPGLRRKSVGLPWMSGGAEMIGACGENAS